LKPNIRSFLFNYFFVVVVVVWTDWIYRKRLGPSFFLLVWIFQWNRFFF
jgi:hypothetical protein